MRILLANWHRNVIGGAESYLRALIPALLNRGYAVALIHGFESGETLDTVDPPGKNVPCWSVQKLGVPMLLRVVRAWKPDLLYCHGLEDTALESALIDQYPSVFFAHGYLGTCLTGRKSHALPRCEACSRLFGPKCLLMYYPRRCGGLNPLTAIKQYCYQIKRRDLLSRYGAVLAASHHICAELLKHGVPGSRLHLTPLPCTTIPLLDKPPARPDNQGRLLFVGRLTELKGGHFLVRAIPAAAERLGRPLALTIAGTGPERQRLERLARKLGVDVDFVGWLQSEKRSEAMNQAELLVVASLWPEPFGLVGIEAGSVGLPSVGFAIGGIPDWLIPGQSGELAPANPPTVAGLTEAIVRALQDPEHYQRLCRGAWEVAKRFLMETHLARLESVLAGMLNSSS